MRSNVWSAAINTLSVNAFGITAKWDAAQANNAIRIDQAILRIDN